jgi:hypothetical protein
VFHLELRQFPHVARVFNLSRDELEARYARPWASGLAIEHEDRRWEPGKAKLTIYEGPEIGVSDMGMGRGWQNVGRTAQEVTETVLAQAQRAAESRSTVEMFKATLRGAARHPVSFPEVLRLARHEIPRSRPSEQLGLAEQSVWELLHQGRLALLGPEGALDGEGWAQVVMSFDTWSGDAGEDFTLEAAGGTSPAG